MALSTFSLGILMLLAFWITARNLELASGSGPPSLTAITMSLPIRVKALAIADQRFILRAFLNSNALPIVIKKSAVKIKKNVPFSVKNRMSYFLILFISIGIDNFLNCLCKLKIFVCNSPGGVGNKCNFQGVINVGPIWMMVHTFGFKCYPRH